MKRVAPSVILKRMLLGVGLLALLTTLPVTRVLVRNVDAELREDFLTQLSIASKTFDAYEITTLTGKDTDIQTTPYLHLKKQLAFMRVRNSHYAHVYILAPMTDQSMAFMVDGEPDDSRVYAPPGKTYTDSAETLRDIFHTQSGKVVGPMDHADGTLVTAFTPIFNPKNGSVMAILGIDVPASHWHMDIAKLVLPSVVFMIVFLVLMLFSFYVVLKKVTD